MSFSTISKNANVLKSSPKEGVTFREEFQPDLHRQLHVYCASDTHPCFEAMYDAKFPSDGARVKVLLRVKINDNLKLAIEGLEEAAQLLAEAGWKDAFLFVVVLGEDVTPLKTAKHPLLLIPKQDYDAFFTPTFTPIVEMQRFRHQTPDPTRTTSERHL